ncbi:MAG TPA: cupin domain-containing protein [Candidatus Koribacter sp.]|jgi:mannose-6-phosphate isomerase-like protein (cupin superfamily)
MEYSGERYLSLRDAVAKLPTKDGKPFAELFRHGSLSVEIYAPRGRDTQQPHSRDEVYVVARGSGVFVNGTQRTPFATGDFLFAAAGEVHRFEEFSDDFYTWVLFYGPEGGEGAQDPDWAVGED